MTLSPQDVQQIRSMTGDQLNRQKMIETMKTLRTINEIFQGDRESAVRFVQYTECEEFSHYSDVSAFAKLKTDASAFLESFNAFRASISRFAEVAEAGIDKTGLIVPPDGITIEEAGHRRHAFQAIVVELGDDDNGGLAG